MEYQEPITHTNAQSYLDYGWVYKYAVI